MATMTFEVRFIWHGIKPNIFKRKFYESEFAQVNNWLKKRTNGQAVTVQELNRLVEAYGIVHNELKMDYSVNATGELIGTMPNDSQTFVTYELGNTL